MQPLMVNCARRRVNTIHNHLCRLASLKEQWREKRMGKQGQEKITPKQKHDRYLHEGQQGEEGRKTTECKTPSPPLSQVMTEHRSQMSRCAGTCGKTSELNEQRGGRKNSQTHQALMS